MSEAHIADDLLPYVKAYAGSPDIKHTPEVIEVSRHTPYNPSAAVQQKFVGASYQAAYEEAARFVTQAETWSEQHGTSLREAKRTLDFGSGWGRISRMLLTRLPATSIYGLDVDAEMTALVQTTLPGINAITVTPYPPTILGDGVMDNALAFSVFSHLAEEASSQWATEFGRVVRPGGLVFITVLDDLFFTQVRTCQESVAKGSTDGFTVSLASMLPDVDASRANYERGEFVYGDAGDDGARSGDFYGWAVAPRAWVEKHWGDAGFEILEWIPSQVLFPQAMVCLRKV